MIPLQTVDIDTSSAATAQEYLAWIVLAVAVLVILIAKLKLRYYALEKPNRRHLKAIRPTLSKASWNRIPISDREDRGPRLKRVNDALRGDLEGRRSPRQAVAGLRTVNAGISARLPAVPPLAIRSAVMGVLVLVFGTLLAVSVEQWHQVLFGSVETASVGLEPITDGLAWLVETTVPGGAMIAMLAATAVVVVYDVVLLEYWFVLGLALVVLSLAVVELDRRTPTDLSPTLYPDRRRLVVRAAMWTAVVWGAAFVAQLLGSALLPVVESGPWYVALTAGLGLAGVGLGFLAVVAYVAVTVGRGLLERLYAVANLRPPWVDPDGRPDLPATLESGPDLPDSPGGDYVTLANVIVRQTVGVVALVTAPVLVYVAAMSVGSGAAAAPLWAFLGGPTWAVGVITLAVVAVGLWALATRERLSPARRWLRRSFVTGTIRSAVALRGVPFVAAALGGMLGWAYLGAQLADGAWYTALGWILVVSLVTAAIAVAVVVVGRSVWDRIGVWLLFSDDDPLPPTDQVVEVLSTPLEDADGEPLYVARVDGRPLAARSPDRMLACIEYIVDERFATGETPELLEHELYEAATERGVVDRQVVAREVRGDVETRITATLADNDGDELDCESLESELHDEYPEPMVEHVLDWLIKRGKVGVRDGKYVLRSRRGV